MIYNTITLQIKIIYLSSLMSKRSSLVIRTNIILNTWWGQITLLAIVIIMSFWPVISGQRMFFDGDLMSIVYPQAVFYKQALLAGQSIVWNPNILTGFPTAVSTTGGFFTPLYYVFIKLLPLEFSYSWLLFSYLLIGSFAMCRLLRFWGHSSIAALIGALVYFIGFHPVDITLTPAMPLLPLLVLIYSHSLKKKHWFYILLGGLLLGYGFYSVHYNWLIIILTGIFFYSLFLSSEKVRRNKIKPLLPIANFVLIASIGFIIGLGQIIPALQFVAISSRSGGLAIATATQGAIHYTSLLTIIFNTFSVPIVTRSDFIYLGALALVLIPLGFWRKNPRARFFSALFIFFILLAIEGSPLYSVWLKIPFMSLFRGPSRWLMLSVFAGAILSAIGLDYVRKNFKAKIFTVTAKIYNALILILVSSTILFNLIIWKYGLQLRNALKTYFIDYIYQNTTQLPLEHYLTYIDSLYEQVASLLSFNNYVFISSLAMIVLVSLIIRLHQNNKIKNFSIMMLLLMALNTMTTLAHDNKTITNAEFNYQPKTAEYLHSPSIRIFSFMPGFSEWTTLTIPYRATNEDIAQLQAELLVPNFNIYYDIKHVDAYEPFMPQRNGDLLAMVGSDRARSPLEKLSNLDITIDEKIELFYSRINILQSLGVTHILSTFNFQNDRLIKIHEIKATRFGIPIYIYQLTETLPEIYFASDVITFGEKQQILDAMSIVTFKPLETTFIECTKCEDRYSTSEGSIEVLTSKAGHYKLKTVNSNQGWIIINTNALPGWTATLDDRLIDINIANHRAIAILIPSGEHILDVNYALPYTIHPISFIN